MTNTGRWLLRGWLVVLVATSGCGGSAVPEPPVDPSSRFADETYQPDPADVPELRALIREGGHVERKNAAKALERIAAADPSAARAAIPDLLEALGKYPQSVPVERKIIWNGKEVPQRE